MKHKNPYKYFTTCIVRHISKTELDGCIFYDVRVKTLTLSSVKTKNRIYSGFPDFDTWGRRAYPDLGMKKTHTSEVSVFGKIFEANKYEHKNSSIISTIVHKQSTIVRLPETNGKRRK